MKQDLLDINLTLKVEDATEDEIQEITAQLFRRLRDTEVEKINLVVSDENDPTRMGEEFTTGLIALEVISSSLPAILAFVGGYLLAKRQESRYKIEAEFDLGDKKLVVTGDSSKEELNEKVRKMINLDRRRKD